MKKAKVLIKSLVIVSMFIIAPFFLQAQGGFDEDVEDNPVPFDGGVSLLVAAGIGYGLKKAHEKRKANRAEAENKD